MNLTNFFIELKQRKVYKVAVAYAAAGWLSIQAAAILFPRLDPGQVMKVFVATVARGFPVALILAWVLN